MNRAAVVAGNAPASATAGQATATTVTADWEAVRRRLHAFVTRRIANPADAEDVVQDVLLRLARELDELRDGDRLDAWAYQVARNAITDEYRRRGRGSAALSRLEAERVEVRSDPTAEPILESDLVGLEACLRPLIDRLDDPYRSALITTAVQGRTQADAAAMAGVTLSGMKSRVQRGRDRLREMLLSCCTVDTADPQLRSRPMTQDADGRCGCT
jgi:RNA polymerase sigma-70 factor (ECF subfamily)